MLEFALAKQFPPARPKVSPENAAEVENLLFMSEDAKQI
jgi:hypothetical protein